MRTRALLSSILAIALLIVFSPAYAVDTPEAVNKVKNKPANRGGIVFRAYCVLCHGERGDGKSRASKLFGMVPLNLYNGRDYTEKIIRYGGKAVGRSEIMPSWQEELSEEQIADVIEYLSIVTDQVGRGGVVFRTNCILCHGVNGDGKGRASVLLNPPPADLTRSDKNDEYKKLIITLGGKAMGRSDRMPIWGEQLLTEQQIDDVVAYLHTILISAAK